MQLGKPSKIGAKEILLTVSNFLSTVVVAFVAMLAVLLIIIRICDMQFYNVESGSMSPLYPKNTLVVVRPVDPADIEVNDVVTYVLNQDLVLVTHRVVEIDDDEQAFYTKGDANASRDPNPVLWDNVVGKVVLGVPYVGAPLSYVTAAENRTTVVAAMILLGAASLIWDLIAKRCKKRIKDNRDERRKLFILIINRQNNKTVVYKI